MRGFRTATAALVLLAAASTAGGQEGDSGDVGSNPPASPDDARGSVAGSIVDAVTAAPIADATVLLQPDVSGAFPGPASFVAASRTVSTNASGHYRFDHLPPGLYRLYVTRFSYRPYSVLVELSGAPYAVSIGLEAEPIALEPVRGRGRSRGPFVAADAFAGDVHLARLMATDLRRRRYLTTDVRELTQADVVEGVTLGEPDVFRAIQRLPGVSTRSDYTAELWTRGAPWSHTRVYYDGVPLFNPLHALGVLSGIGSSAVGAVWFHPGARSAGMGEGGAGVIDFRSRTGAGAGELNLRGDLSLMTAGLALDQRVLDGRAGWMLAGRSTYLDWLSEVADRATDGAAEAYPYGFRELAGRVDVAAGAGVRVDASWLWESDRLTSDGLEGVDPLRAEWGNGLGQVSVQTRIGALSLRHTLGGSEHRGRVVTDSQAVVPVSFTRRRQGESSVRWVGLSGTLSPEPRTLAGPVWSVGWSVQHHRVHYFGPLALPVPRSESLSVSTGASGYDRLDSVRVDWVSSLPLVAVWGERTWTPDERLSIRAGLRVEASDEVENGGSVRPAPRVSIRYTPLPEAALSVGYSRVYQYAQALAPGGVQLASLVSSDAWLLAGRGVPALRADVVTAGLESWIAPGRLVALNLFGRRSTGLALPDPTPGPVYERIGFVRGENRAYGAEASLRQVAGPVTGSVAYTYTRSRVRVVGLEFPSSADRTHVLDATLMLRPLPALRVGAAFTAATGVPFTHTISNPDECSAQPGCDPERLPWAAEPHGVRAPTFASLDLLADWTWSLGETEVGLYAQLRNALGRENATVYAGDGTACLPVGCNGADLRNAYERGLPRLPVVGVRVRR